MSRELTEEEKAGLWIVLVYAAIPAFGLGFLLGGFITLWSM